MSKRDLLLWTSILLPPAIWFLSLTANFALAPLPCGNGSIIRGVVWIVALVITAATGALAVSLWRNNRVEALPAEGAPADRVRAMSIAGVVLSVSFFVVIVAQSLPDLIMAGCS
jgi:hypothetical protein